VRGWCSSTAIAGWAALRRLGRDRASIEPLDLWANAARRTVCRPCEVAEAVMGVLARTQGRSFAAIEEALLLRELTQGLGVSQREAALRCGRDVSWVNRRLTLLSALPEAAVGAVREGRLSTWSAARVIAHCLQAHQGPQKSNGPSRYSRALRTAGRS